jgi:hypothetical protein
MVKTVKITGEKINFIQISSVVDENGKILGFNPIPSTSSLVANIFLDAGLDQKWIVKIYMV